MARLAPLTKLILTAAVSVWAMLLQSPHALAVLIAVQIGLIIAAGIWKTAYKAVLSLTIFALILMALQYVLGTDMMLAVAGGLRMMAMTVIFVLVLATTRLQDLSAALVGQLHVPYEYAFMFTAALRFIPDFLAESNAVREAQACRGYQNKGNIVKRLISYLAIVEPLVLKAITRSETMAMSLELRGFAAGKRSFMVNVALGGVDYMLLAILAVVTAGLIGVRF